MTGKQRQKAREQVTEDLLDEIAPTRHNRGKARYVGRVKNIKGDIEPLIEADSAEKIVLEQEQVQRFLGDMRGLGGLAKHHEKLFPGVPLDPELTFAALSPTAQHSAAAALRVMGRLYIDNLLPALLALQERGRVVTAQDKRNLVTGWLLTHMSFEDGQAVYPEPDWIAEQIRADGIPIESKFVKAVLAGRLCEHCGGPISPTRGPSARFCTDAHRKDAFRAKKRKAVQTA